MDVLVFCREPAKRLTNPAYSYVEQQLQVLNAARCYHSGRPWIFESRPFPAIVSWEMNEMIRRTSPPRGEKPPIYNEETERARDPNLGNTYFEFNGLG